MAYGSPKRHSDDAESYTDLKLCMGHSREQTHVHIPYVCGAHIIHLLMMTAAATSDRNSHTHSQTDIFATMMVTGWLKTHY